MINLWWNRSTGLAPKLNSFILQQNTCLCVSMKAASYCKVQFSLSGKIQIPFPLLNSVGEEWMSLVSKRVSSFPTNLAYISKSYILKFFTVSQGLLFPWHQSLLSATWFQDSHFTSHLPTRSDRFTQWLYQETIFSVSITILGPSGSVVHHTRQGILIQLHNMPYILLSPSTNGFCTLCGRKKGNSAE